MNKNIVIAILGIVVVVLCAFLFVNSGGNKGNDDGNKEKKTQQQPGEQQRPEAKNSENPPQTQPIPSPTNREVKAGTVMIDGQVKKIEKGGSNLPKKRSVERRPLEPEATKRLHDGPVIVKSIFEASGKAEYASGGKAVSGSYIYTTTVIACSEIIDKGDDSSGMIRVKERRQFLRSRDSLSLRDVDVKVALDTLPVGQVKGWVDGVCCLVSDISSAIACLPPAAPFATVVGGVVEVVNMATDVAFAMLDSIDGISARGMLGAFGVKIPKNVEDLLNAKTAEAVKKGLKDVHVALQSIEGKSFIITYVQEDSGKPLNVDYENEDGQPISEAEWEILRSANVFLDSNVVPDTRYRVGDSWTIWADEVMDMFSMAGEGRTEGKIRVERVADQTDESWTLKLDPSKIDYRSDSGASAGTIRIKDGNGLVDAENISVKSLHTTADGNLKYINKERHWLFFEFVTNIEGNSNLRFSLTVEPVKVKPNK